MAQFRFNSLLRPNWAEFYGTASWQGILIGTLAGALTCTPSLFQQAHAETETQINLAQVQREQTPVVGVVRSPDNANQWQDIVARLEASGLTYRVVEQEALQQPSGFAELTVLFLPSIESISPNQLLAVEAWMASGGRVIASGPMGASSSHGVRRALQSLLGAYWAFPIPRSSALQVLDARNQPWLPEDPTTPTLQGGVVMPASLSSQTVVTWQDIAATDLPYQPDLLSLSNGIPAVVVTARSTFLGWEWGNSGTADFDIEWLQAAVERYENARPLGLAANPSGSSASTGNAPPSAESLLGRSPSLPTSSGSSTSGPSLLARPSAPVPTRPTPTFTPIRPETVQDPAEQVAPAGLEVEVSALPITTLEAIAMRQELENLVGRFESALLSANSADSSTNLQQGDTALRSNDKDTLVASEGGAASSNSPNSGNEALDEALQILREFPQMVASRDYTEARQQWLRARRLLWENFPTDRPQAQPEIRAMWLDRGTIVRAGSERGLAQIFDRLAEAGINTVFFETVNAGYPIYPSQVAPQQNPLTRSWDPLESAVDLAHERGIELHAWVWTFAAGNSLHNTLLNQPANYPGPLIAAHPDWANYDNRGNMVPPGQTKPFLDPANPAVRSYLLRLFEEITTRYDVDGLQLDYIRYPFQDPSAGRSYGYGIAARQQFQRVTGVDPVNISPSDRVLWQQWTEFRTEQINSFVADVSRTVRQRRPDLILSTAVFAMSEHERIQKIQQNWEVWARNGDVDLIVPMSYAMDTNRLQRLAGPWLQEEADLGAVLVLPGIRLLNLPEAAALDQIQALRDMPSGGYSLFAVENLSDTLYNIFSRTQGQEIARNAAPVPYREPFLAAAERYAALQREWSFLLDSGELLVRPEQLSQWQEHAEALEEALNQLAEQPSPQRLSIAQRQLSEFQFRFEGWVSLQSLNHNYRLRTWENRLEILENLLNYGEQVIFERPSVRRAAYGADD